MSGLAAVGYGDFEESEVVGHSSSQQSRASRLCDVCGSRNFVNTGFGVWACGNCGTQSKDVRLQAQDVEDGNLNVRAATKRRRNTVSDVVRLPTSGEVQRRVLSSWLYIMEQQVDWLSRLLPTRELRREHAANVRGIVKRYLKWWSGEQRVGVGSATGQRARHAYPMFAIINGDMVLPHDRRYVSVLPAGVPSPWIPGISCELTLAVTLAAVRMAHLPLTAVEVLRGAAQGEFPYMAAWGGLPAHLREHCTFAATFFTPGARPLPSCGSLEHLTSLLCACLGIALPQPNRALILAAWSHTLGLGSAEMTRRCARAVDSVPEVLLSAPHSQRVRDALHTPPSAATLPGCAGTPPLAVSMAPAWQRADSATGCMALLLCVALTHPGLGHWCTQALRRACAAGWSACDREGFRAAAPVPPWDLRAAAACSILHGAAEGSDGGGWQGREEQALSVRDVWRHSSLQLSEALRGVLHGGAALPGLAATGTNKVQKGGGEKAAFTRWRLHALLMDARGEGAEEGGVGEGDGSTIVTASGWHSLADSEAGGGSTGFGAQRDKEGSVISTVSLRRHRANRPSAGVTKTGVGFTTPTVQKKYLADFVSLAGALHASGARAPAPPRKQLPLHTHDVAQVVFPFSMALHPINRAEAVASLVEGQTSEGLSALLAMAADSVGSTRAHLAECMVSMLCLLSAAVPCESG